MSKVLLSRGGDKIFLVAKCGSVTDMIEITSEMDEVRAKLHKSAVAKTMSPSDFRHAESVWLGFMEKTASMIASRKHDYVFIRDEKPFEYDPDNPHKAMMTIPLFNYHMWEAFRAMLTGKLAANGLRLFLAMRIRAGRKPGKPVPNFSYDGRPGASNKMELQMLNEAD